MVVIEILNLEILPEKLEFMSGIHFCLAKKHYFHVYNFRVTDCDQNIAQNDSNPSQMVEAENVSKRLKMKHKEKGK